MRENYLTKGIVLRSRPHKEDSTEVMLLTETLGRVRAVAQAAKRPGATFAAATQPGASGEFALIKGRYSWRIVGAYHITRPYTQLSTSERELYLNTLGIFGRVIPEEEYCGHVFTSLLALPDRLVQEKELAQIETLFDLLSALGYADNTIRPTTKQNLTRAVNEGLRAAQL